MDADRTATLQSVVIFVKVFPGELDLQSFVEMLFQFKFVPMWIEVLKVGATSQGEDVSL